MAALCRKISLGKLLFIFISFLKLYVLSAYALLMQLFETHREFKVEGVSDERYSERVAIVTGGENGIGAEVVRQLLKLGFHVILGSRLSTDTAKSISRFKAEIPNARVEHIPLDVSSLKSVRAFASTFKQKQLPLHLLINNAGVILLPHQVTDEGHDRVFCVNYLGHVLLTLLLLDVMKTTGTPSHRARIVNLSSVVHYIGEFNDLEEVQGRPYYSSHITYARSKLAVLMSTYELNRRFSLVSSDHVITDGGLSLADRCHVTVNAVHPGIVDSGLFRNMHWSWAWIQRRLSKFLLKSVPQGADTVLYAALSPDLEARGGLYLSNCEPSPSSAVSYDPGRQRKLWLETCRLLKMDDSIMSR